MEVKVLVIQSCLDSCIPIDCSLSGSSVQILEWVAIPFSRGIFLTQRSNLGLLHCRQIVSTTGASCCCCC